MVPAKPVILDIRSGFLSIDLPLTGIGVWPSTSPALGVLVAGRRVRLDWIPGTPSARVPCGEGRVLVWTRTGFLLTILAPTRTHDAGLIQRTYPRLPLMWTPQESGVHQFEVAAYGPYELQAGVV